MLVQVTTFYNISILLEEETKRKPYHIRLYQVHLSKDVGRCKSQLALTPLWLSQVDYLIVCLNIILYLPDISMCGLIAKFSIVVIWENILFLIKKIIIIIKSKHVKLWSVIITLLWGYY